MNDCSRLGNRRRASAHAAEAREAHVQSILDTIPDAMVVIDIHGIMQSFSAAASRLFAYSADEVIGRNVSMLMPRRRIAHSTTAISNAICAPASGESSGLGASSLASVRMARPFQWSCRSVR